MVQMSREPMSVTSLRSYLAVGVLFVVNLLNYMDRYTITGVLTDVKRFYNIDNADAGALQTIFICAYMLCAPACGYLGDRYNRRLIMACGIAAWVLAVLASSFVPSNHFWLFMLLRGVVGVGEASYVTVAPTIIADLFAADKRSQMLMFFFFAIPVGTGLGFMVGANVADWANDWRWGVRVTPILGVICLVLILLGLPEPRRGEADGGTEDVAVDDSTIIEDLTYLIKNRTYVLSTIGFTAVVFVVGSLVWWTPQVVLDSIGMQGKVVDDTVQAHVSFVFGLISVASGLLGVSIGSGLAQFWKRTNSAADPLVCGLSALAAIPFTFIALVLVQYDLTLAWVSVFLAVTLLCFNWSVIMDMLLYIIVPNRRATASAFQILMSHLFGDAFSPYFIGVMSEWLQGDDESYSSHFYGLQRALYIPTFVLAVAAAFFLLSSFTVDVDRRRAEHDAHQHHRTTPASDGDSGLPTPSNIGSPTGAENLAFET